MTCETFEQWLIQARDHQLEPEKLQRIEEHVSGCPRCAETRRLLQVSDLLLQQAPAPSEPGPYFYPRLMTQIRETHQSRDMSWEILWSFARRLAAGSAVVLLLLVGTLIYDLTTDTDLPVIVDTDLEPSFPDGPLTNLVLQSGDPQNEQILDALMSPGGRPTR